MKLTSCLGHIAHPFKNGKKQLFITCLTSWFYGKIQIPRSSICSTNRSNSEQRWPEIAFLTPFTGRTPHQLRLAKYLLTDILVLNSQPCTHTLSRCGVSSPLWGRDKTRSLPQALQNLPERLRSPVLAASMAEPARPPGLRPLAASAFPSCVHHHIQAPKNPKQHHWEVQVGH